MNLAAILKGRDLVVTFGTSSGVYRFSLLGGAASDLTSELRPKRPGSGAEEWIVRNKPVRIGDSAIHPDLFVVAVAKVGADWASIDLAIETPWTSSRDVYYDLEIARVGGAGGDRVMLQRSNVVHGRWQRKMLAFRFGEPPEHFSLPKTRLALQAEGSIPNYLHDYVLDPWLVEEWKRRWRNVSGTDCLNADLGFWVAYQGHTGNDDGIGLVPAWWAAALVSEDPELLAICAENDRLFGGFPIHVRDEATWRPLSVLDRPSLVLVHADPPGSQIWRKFDDAHHPLAGAMGFLVTDSFLLEEEVEFIANWIDLNSNAGYRGFDLGLCIDHEQRRATAWNLRTKFWASQWLARSDRFTRTVEANLQRLLHTLDGPYKGIRVEGSKTSWFCDTESLYNPSYNESYLLTALEWGRTMGIPVDEIQKVLAKWPIARHRQWPLGYASPYLAAVAQKDGRPYTVEESFAKTYVNRPPGQSWSWRGTRGYGAHDRAALAGAVILGVQGATDALARCESSLENPTFVGDPLWALEDEEVS